MENDSFFADLEQIRQRELTLLADIESLQDKNSEYFADIEAMGVRQAEMIALVVLVMVVVLLFAFGLSNCQPAHAEIQTVNSTGNANVNLSLPTGKIPNLDQEGLKR